MALFSELPDSLQYLIKPASLYGKYQFDRSLEDFVAQASRVERREIKAVARKIKQENHFEEIQDYLDRYPMTEDEDSAKLYFFLGVIDYFGHSVEADNRNTLENHMRQLQRHGSFRLASGRMHAAKLIPDFGRKARAAIPLLQVSCSDEDERVQVWSHYALVRITGEVEPHQTAIQQILSCHLSINEFGSYDQTGSEAAAALEKLAALRK